MASSSKCTLSKSQIPTHSIPLFNNSYFMSSIPLPAEWNITTTPHWKKRKKENQPLFDPLPTLNSDEPKFKKRPYRARQTTTDNLANIFKAIRGVNWTLGDFFYYTFCVRYKFLARADGLHPILECWYRSSDGRVPGALAQEFP